MIRLYILFFAAAVLLLASCGDDDDSSPYSAEPSGRIVFTSDREGNEEVFVMGGDGSGPINLTNHESADREAKFNANGDAIAFVSNRNEPNVWIMQDDGSEPRQVTEGPAVDARPVWSPDGSRIAHFSARDQRIGHLWLTDVESGGTGPLLDFLPNEAGTECFGGTPTDWPEEDMMVYQGIQSNISANQICALDITEFSVRLLLGSPRVVLYDGTLSPDGTKIAYSSDETGNFDVWVANIDGTEPLRLTVDPGIDSGPAWSPDGEWIAFSSERDGDSEIYIIRPDGSEIRQLTDNDAEDTLPDWAG